MNDRYLFKAKGESTEKWYIGLLTRADVDICWIKTKDGEYVCKTSTICQCTGLKDKNGNLIWENDIIKHYNDTEDRENYDVGCVIWNKNFARFERTSIYKDSTISISCDCKYEVIGNIFDNPELLEME